MLLDQERFEELLRLLDSHPEWLEALQERIVDEKAILRVLEQRAEVREAVRRQILQDDFLRLPTLVEQLIEAQQRTEAQVRELVAIQQRHEAQLRALTETQQRTEQLVQELVAVQQQHEAQLQQTISVQQQMLEEIRDLARSRQRFDDWLRGEEGRRRGEQFERETIRRAWRIFRDGEGGSPDAPIVQAKIRQWLSALPPEDIIDNDESDPNFADLVWWKGNKVVVAEISIKVDTTDVNRAYLRTQTLRKAGVDAIGVVLGEEWAFPAVRDLAEELGVEWFIRGDVSEGVRAFQRIAAEQV